MSFYKGDEIDLGDVMREQFYLALPMKPLCRPDCRGICRGLRHQPQPGQCSCQQEWVDPRLDALRKLMSSENR